jgi:predicted O-methyltransferase YrrM
MIDPYADIAQLALPQLARGWENSHSPALGLHVSTARTVIEVGSFMGASVAWMAEHNPAARFYCVDTWLGSPEIGEAEMEGIGYQHGRIMLLERFLSNMIAAGIEDRVTPIIQTSTSGARILRAQGVTADLIYIDAGHDYLECFADLVSYAPLLAKGGVMIADDYEGFPGVRGAVERFCVEAGMTCEIVNGQAVMRQKYRLQVEG